MIPAPRITEHEGFFVLRDDIVAGGTKQRVLAPMMGRAEEFVYASPASGYAQVALARACADSGTRATVFVAQREVMHKRTAAAKQAGAKIIQVPHGYLSNVEAKARAYCDATGAYLLPFGFDDFEIRAAIAAFAGTLPIKPKEVWSVAGSGTLTRSLQMAWPWAKFHAVRIGREPSVGRAHSYDAPEKFDNDALLPPPFPSCSNYDAKAWRFIISHAQPGALFWNVAA